VTKETTLSFSFFQISDHRALRKVGKCKIFRWEKSEFYDVVNFCLCND